MTRPRVFRNVVLAAAVLSALVSWPGCGRPSEGSAIRAFIEDVVARAEKNDGRALRSSLAEDYRDFQGRDRDATLRLVMDYHDRYRGVVIHLLGLRLSDIGRDGQASVECEVSLSHGAAEVLRKLIRYGDFYRFRLEIRRSATGERLLAGAEWESVGLTELFPESLEVLKKLFPGF